MDKNCTKCKYGFFGKCETLKNHKEYNKIKALSEQFEFKNNYVCDQFKSKYIEYPIEVSKINTPKDNQGLSYSTVGKFAKISPCGKEYEGKTYLGLFLGELPIDTIVRHNNETKELNISFMTNPAIFVFDLNKIIYGCESWWGIIQSEEDLKEITTDDINNVWYVKAFKALSEG